MGCDIHIHVEYKKKLRVHDSESENEERWLCGDHYIVNPYYNAYAENPEFVFVEFYNNRNYDLFATLADVRNYGGTTVIHQPKGLPKDVSAQVKKDSEDWGVDGHSHSWFTLKELIDFQNSNHVVKHKGFISPSAQKALDDNGVLPCQWCQHTNVGGWECREWEEEKNILEPIIEKLKERADELNVIYDWTWDTNPRDAYELSDKIRIVFWFDN